MRLCTVNANHIAHSTSSFFIPRIIQALGQRHSICINLHFNIFSCTLFTACQFNLEIGEKGRGVKNACITLPINMDPDSYLICRIRFIGRPVSRLHAHFMHDCDHVINRKKFVSFFKGEEVGFK